MWTSSVASMLYRLLVACTIAASANALRLPATGASNVRMAMPASDVPATAAEPAVCRTTDVECFFGGNPVPEGAKCVFRGDACKRGRCKVNSAPCKDNQASMGKKGKK